MFEEDFNSTGQKKWLSFRDGFGNYKGDDKAVLRFIALFPTVYAFRSLKNSELLELQSLLDNITTRYNVYWTQDYEQVIYKIRRRRLRHKDKTHIEPFVVTEFKELTCTRCEWKWLPRNKTVKMCPNCKSLLWRIPRLSKL
ncbi:MAG: hypothetical protein WCW13_05705 [archaeon]|jgi:hypothetical protein